MGDKTLTVPRVEDRCVNCGEPVGLHNTIKAMNCLTELAQEAGRESDES